MTKTPCPRPAKQPKPDTALASAFRKASKALGPKPTKKK